MYFTIFIHVLASFQSLLIVAYYVQVLELAEVGWRGTICCHSW